MDALSPQRDFSLLSIKDLLDARDHYHVHLMHKENVVGTAIGKYLIRKSDPWPTRENPNGDDNAAVSGSPTSGNGHAPQPRKERTLANSEVRVYSWPCILVFVKKWEDPTAFNGSKLDPSDMVPKTLYLPDGRVVPVCVVEANLSNTAPPAIGGNIDVPGQLLGGGYPLLIDVQGEERVASVGCLVTDGHKTYALTNRHVCGDKGQEITALIEGEELRVGVSAGHELRRMGFEDVYAGWPGKQVYVNLDAGLIELDDVRDWTAQVYGIGTLGPLADLSINNLSLRLINCPVRAYGCVSKEMNGRIKALFYRYKSVGGFEYVSDFLIGADDTLVSEEEANQPLTRPGDSGTIWTMEHKGQQLPIAMQWGGQIFNTGDGNLTSTFALATGLSTICNLLNVDLVRDWRTGLPEYWGDVGHYSIGAKAIHAIANPALKALMRKNLRRISFADSDLDIDSIDEATDPVDGGPKPFIPMANVPDLAWKRRTGRGDENPNHYADVDATDEHGNSLLSISLADPNNVTPARWLEFYNSIDDRSKGLLPFRVWQFYDAMVEYVSNDQLEEFICTAGILAHYVGDACQPLHSSYLHDGDPKRATDVWKKKDGEYQWVKVSYGAGVHTAYETTMLNRHTAELLTGIGQPAPGMNMIAGGHAAAVSMVDLMARTRDLIPPMDLVEAYVAAKEPLPGGGRKPAAADVLWSKFHTKTIKAMKLGCQYLAMLWESAWIEGGGDQTLGAVQPRLVSKQRLMDLYLEPTFLESHKLSEMEEVLEAIPE